MLLFIRLNFLHYNLYLQVSIIFKYRFSEKTIKKAIWNYSGSLIEFDLQKNIHKYKW